MNAGSYESMAGRLYFTPGRISERCRKLRAEGYRLCHNRSARKHRRRGDHVFYVAYGLYAWKRKT